MKSIASQEGDAALLWKLNGVDDLFKPIAEIGIRCYFEEIAIVDEPQFPGRVYIRSITRKSEGRSTGSDRYGLNVLHCERVAAQL